MKLLKNRWALLAALFLIAVGVWYFRRSNGNGPAYRTAAVEQGDLNVTINATGTVQPEEVIDVGAQVAGLILQFGTDLSGKPIDYGSQVEEGGILARIDDSLYTSDVAQADAALKRAEADLLQLNAKLFQAERDWDRAQKAGQAALSVASYDQAQANFRISQANVTVGEAQIAQAKAALARAQRNLSYCTIRSPVKGVIIDRRVNIGQTVVSSLNAPSLFLIAKDLTRMQVWVSVNEADIGQIKEGQPVVFTVDAFPREQFKGRVGKIRLNASMTQNVVSYIVEVIADNSGGRLLPYLTANVSFEIASYPAQLLVPSAALRFVPSMARPEQGSGAKGGSESSGQGAVWVLDDDTPRSIPVKVVASDSAQSAVVSADLKPGMQLVVSEIQPESAPVGGTNPFAPQPMRGGRKVP